MSISTDSAGPTCPPEPTRFLVFSASLRTGSYNTRLAQLAVRTIEQRGATVDMASMAAFDCPSFNQDIEDTKGFPPGAEEFRSRIEANDALVIASPEYNGSMPGLLKNAIDWVSRYDPQPFDQRHVLLMSASPSMAGGNRGLWSLRIPLEHLGARVFPDMFSLATANQALNDEGQIINPVLSHRFAGNVEAFMNLVEAAKFYPRLKKAWIEFLGEQPNPALEHAGRA
ncbi:MAG TPA: NAD(P)H-dependent oxidoreductase [Chloroflexota bacterium]|nr:NAD(P)H-dependent oxidoreductase [Chloroflexota bacterium]